MLVMFAGLPGTGKSALARALASLLGAAVLDKDVIRAALFEPGRVEYSQEQDDFCQELMLQTVGWLLAKDPALYVFLDGRTFSREYQRRRVMDSGYSWALIECVCDEQTALDRVAAQPDHPAKNRTAALYREVARAWEPIPAPKLTVNTDEPLEACVTRAVAYITAARRAAKPNSPTRPTGTPTP